MRFTGRTGAVGLVGALAGGDRGAVLLTGGGCVAVRLGCEGAWLFWFELNHQCIVVLVAGSLCMHDFVDPYTV